MVMYKNYEEISMFDFIRTELKKMNIDLVGSLRLDECTTKRSYLLERNGISDGSVIVFAVPYFSDASLGDKNISAYAISRDYHLFFKSLFDNLLTVLREKYPDNIFTGFSDHSPIDEIDAACHAGLGILGKNHLLITEKHSSYVFIGEIITDAVLPSSYKEKRTCGDCGNCLRACPVGMSADGCLSSITQKKGELTEKETKLITQNKCAWGCDICQQVCPHTKNAISNGTIFTPISFFKENLTPTLTHDMISQMSDDEFSKRAYSWRGKSVIMRNLKILEGKET